MNQKQIARIIAVVTFCIFLYYIQDVLLPVVLSVILFYVLNPLVTRLSSKWPEGLGLDRTFSIAISFILFITVLVVLFKFIVPPFAVEFKHLGENFPQYIASTQNLIDSVEQWYTGVEMPAEINQVVLKSLQNIMAYMVNFTQQVATALIGIFSQFLKLITIPIITFLLLKDKEKILSGALEFIPKDHRNKTQKIIHEISAVINSYVKGEVILCLVIGVVSGAALFLMGVKYFLILGLIAAITELIPIVGPFIGAVPAVVVAFLTSPLLAIEVILLYLLIQALENSLLVPKVMGDKLNLHPLTVIMSILILGKLIGVWGLFFAAPIVAMIKIIYLEIRNP